MTDTFIQNIIDEMNLRFKALLKVHSLTNELEKSFKSDDNAGIRETLTKRAIEIDGCKMIDENIAKLTRKEKDVNLKNFVMFLKGDESKSEFIRDERLKELIKIIKESKLVAQKIIKKDEELNRHISGKNSFYNK